MNNLKHTQSIICKTNINYSKSYIKHSSYTEIPDQDHTQKKTTIIR